MVAVFFFSFFLFAVSDRCACFGQVSWFSWPMVGPMCPWPQGGVGLSWPPETCRACLPVVVCDALAWLRSGEMLCHVCVSIVHARCQGFRACPLGSRRMCMSGRRVVHETHVHGRLGVALRSVLQVDRRMCVHAVNACSYGHTPPRQPTYLASLLTEWTTRYHVTTGGLLCVRALRRNFRASRCECSLSDSAVEATV